MEYLLYEQEGSVATLTINRPRQLNALTAEVLQELSTALDLVDLATVRCLIITGAGEKAFVAGADVSAMVSLSVTEARTFSQYGNEVMHKIDNFPVPVLAAIDGYAFGGGCELALSCDLRLASDKTVLSMPETSLGITPGFGGTQRLARLVSPAIAKEIIFTARRISVQRAYEIGLVNAIYPASEFQEKVMALAQQIAANGPIAVRAAKTAINQGLQLDLKTAIDLEAELFASCFETQDQQHAMQAFVNKREKPAFTNH